MFTQVAAGWCWQQLGWTLSDAVNTVKCSWWWAKTSPPKHVELTWNNKLTRIVASCWLFFTIISRCTDSWTYTLLHLPTCTTFCTLNPSQLSADLQPHFFPSLPLKPQIPGPTNGELCSSRLDYSLTYLTLRLLMSYIYGAPILDVSRSHTTTQHSR